MFCNRGPSVIMIFIYKEFILVKNWHCNEVIKPTKGKVAVEKL